MISSIARRQVVGKLPLASRISIGAARSYATEEKRSLFGDYPEVPKTYAQHNDPYKKYDDQQGRRNFNEPLKPYNELYDVWSPDRYDLVSDWVALRNNLIFAAGIIAFGTFIYNYAAPEKPAIPREYPHNGLLTALGGTEEETYNQARVDTSA